MAKSTNIFAKVDKVEKECTRTMSVFELAVRIWNDENPNDKLDPITVEHIDQTMRKLFDIMRDEEMGKMANEMKSKLSRSKK